MDADNTTSTVAQYLAENRDLNADQIEAVLDFASSSGSVGQEVRSFAQAGGDTDIDQPIRQPPRQARQPSMSGDLATFDQIKIGRELPERVKPMEGKPSSGQIKQSVTPEWIYCFEDGRRYKTLRRPLDRLGLTPEAYRTKFGLPQDYPMVAPNYTEKRSELAKQRGLGRSGRTGRRGR